MKGFKMSKQIQQPKETGFTRSRAAKQLNINRETVTRYWNMTADELAIQLYRINRELLLLKYEDIIINWLRQYPTMTAAQVCDWLKEHYEYYGLIEPPFRKALSHISGENEPPLRSLGPPIMIYSRGLIITTITVLLVVGVVESVDKP
jgi:hypothetical protein